MKVDFMVFETISPQTTKQQVIQLIEQLLAEHNFKVVEKNSDKPWGAYFLIDSVHIEKFVELYFPQHLSLLTDTSQKLSPKILLVAPKQRLSWQYHFRRAEIWKVVLGPVSAIQSVNDQETHQKSYATGELIQHDKEVRHRLIGEENWGIVAEIWQHTDANHPSNEDDIVRLQDDYRR